MVRSCKTITAICLWLSLTSHASAEPVTFRNEVMAVLSKAGCNQGTCHGNQNGKNGFKLSLRGQDPEFDYQALTRDAQGRRASPFHPEASLLVQKAIATLPHEGGRRFSVGSLEHDILIRWLSAGMPNDSADTPRLTVIQVTPTESILVEPENRQSIQVKAYFTNGDVRDVTRLAVFESSNPEIAVDNDGTARKTDSVDSKVRETTVAARYLDRQAIVQLAFVPARPDFNWREIPENNAVDRHVFSKLRTLRIEPSELCSDSVFLRRAFLDVLGVLPTADEAKGFLQDSGKDKRSRLIDHLLQRSEFADFWALKWSDLLRNEEKALDRKGTQVYHEWIRQCIADGKPINEFAREILSARGSTYSHPPANFYRALRDPQIRAETVGQVFLGIRIQCARCHNHPFDRWTQDDYYGLSAFFPRIDYQITDNQRTDGLDKHEFVGEQIVVTTREGEVRHPSTKATVAPLLLGEGHKHDFSRDADRLQVLADWVADPNNPFFARTQVNRVWYHLLGRGIVEPIDDFRISNPPVNEPLLEALTADFRANGFDLRHTIRTIMNSRTYQLSAVPTAANRDDTANFSHAQIRPLQAEQLLDALSLVTGAKVRHVGYPSHVRAGQIPAVAFYRQKERRASPGEDFLKVFGKPERLFSCECERSGDTTLAQAFQLISGPLVHRLLTQSDNRLSRMLDGKTSNPELIEGIYLSALSRWPTEVERQTAVHYLEKAKDRRAALEDVVWGLVNAKEFLLRQ